MIFASRTLIVCVLIIATEGGVIHRLLWSNAASHGRKFSVPLEGEQHRVRRLGHPNCHGHKHEHDHQHGLVRHHKHDRHHNHGHHNKHGHRFLKGQKLSSGRASYQEPHYHVSPQLFHWNKKPLHSGLSQYHRNKFIPYWFKSYNYLPYQVKHQAHTYGYHLKPLYFYFRKPQISSATAQIPHQYLYFYPINNQVQPTSETSLSVNDNEKPFSNSVNLNVYDTNSEGITYTQNPGQDLELSTKGNQNAETFEIPITLISFEPVESNTTPFLKVETPDVIEKSTVYNKNTEHTTQQYSIDLDEINESSNTRDQIQGSSENKDTFTSKYQTDVSIIESNVNSNFGVSDSFITTHSSYERGTTPTTHNIHDTSFEETSVTHDQILVHDSGLITKNHRSEENFEVTALFDESNPTPVWENNIDNLNAKGESKDYTNNPEHTTRQYVIDLVESPTASTEINESFENDDLEDTGISTSEDPNRVFVTRSDDSSNFGASDTIETTPSYEEIVTEKSYNSEEPVSISDYLERDVTVSNELNLKDVKEPSVTYHSTLEEFHDQTTKISVEDVQFVELDDSSYLISGSEEINSNEGLKFGANTGTTNELLRTKSNVYDTSTTRNSHDVATSESITDKNKVDFDEDRAHTAYVSHEDSELEGYERSTTMKTIPRNHSDEATTVDSKTTADSKSNYEASTFFAETSFYDHYTTDDYTLKNDEMKDNKGSIDMETVTQNRFEATTIDSRINDKVSTFYPSPFTERYYTTVSSLKNDETEDNRDLIDRETEPQNLFEETSTIGSKINDEVYTFYPVKSGDRYYTTEESLKNEEIKGNIGSITMQTIPQDRLDTTIESPKNDRMNEKETSLMQTTVPQNRFEEPITINSKFNEEVSTITSEPSSDEIYDQDILLFEEIMRNSLEVGTTLPEITESKTKDEIDQPNETATGSFLDDVSADVINSSIGELSEIYHFKSTSISPAHTTIVEKNSIPVDNVHQELEEETNMKTYLDSIGTKISTPFSEVLPEEGSLTDQTVSVSSSSMFTDFEVQPSMKYNIDASPTASSILIDFTENSREDFPKLKTEIITTYSPPSIFTDFTENTKVGLSELESNTNPNSVSSIFNDLTENYKHSTSNRKIIMENRDYTGANIYESSGDGSIYNYAVTDKILENTSAKRGLEDKWNTVEVTEDDNKEDWNMEKSIESVSEENDESKVAKNENVVLENVMSIPGSSREKIHVELTETSTPRYAVKTIEAESDEFNKLEKTDLNELITDDSKKQNIVNMNIATEYFSTPENTADVTEKNLEDDNRYLSAVTSKSNSIYSEELTEPTTTAQESKFEHSFGTEGDSDRLRIVSESDFSDVSNPTFDSNSLFTVEVKELHTPKLNSNIQDNENSATTFEHYGYIKNGTESIITTESNSVTDFYEEKISSRVNEFPTTHTPLEYSHGNLFKEISNLIRTVPAPADIEYLGVTDAGDLVEITPSVRIDQYEQTKINLVTTVNPNKLPSENSVDPYSNSNVFNESSSENNASGSLYVEIENNVSNDYEGLLKSSESYSDTNSNSKLNIKNSDQFGVEYSLSEEIDKNSENVAEEGNHHLNKSIFIENFNQEENNLEITSPNYDFIVKSNIDQTTLTSDTSAGGGNRLNDFSSNEKSEEGKDKIVSGQTFLNNTNTANNTSKVIDEVQSIVDYSSGVMRFNEELSSTEIDSLNEENSIPETIEEKNYEPEVLETVTERKEQDSKGQNAEISEPMLIKNVNDTGNQEAVKTNSMDGDDVLETSTKFKLSDYTVDKRDEIESDNSPFHVDLLNYNDTIYGNTKEELSTDLHIIKETTVYNMNNFEKDSTVGKLYVSVNEEETNKTNLLSDDEDFSVDDKLTNSHVLKRSARLDYIDPDFLVSNDTLDFIILNLNNNMKYQYDSTKPRYITKRDVVKANETQLTDESEELVTDKKILKNEASEVLAMLGKSSISSYQEDEPFDDEDEEYDYNDYESLSNVNPLDLIEVKDEEDEEDETKLTYESGPSIMDLVSLSHRVKKQ